MDDIDKCCLTPKVESGLTRALSLMLGVVYVAEISSKEAGFAS